MEIRNSILKAITIFLFLAFGNLLLFSQNSDEANEGVLTIELQIDRGEEKPFQGVTGKLYEKGVLAKTILSDVEGIISFNLKANSEFIIEVSAKDYITKKVEINTVVAGNEKKTFQIGFPMYMFIPCPGLDLTVLKDPILKVSYNEVRREFMQNKDYEKIMLKKLKELGEQNDTCRDEQYNNIVRKANKLFDEKKYLEARKEYVDAVDQQPTNQFAIDRIAEIDRLLANDKSKDKLYNDYIAQGDKQLANKSYVMAKEFYKRALTLKAGEKYPAAQIEAIDKLLADKNKQDQEKQSQEAKYQQLLTQGSVAMTDDVCGKAMQSFKDALAVKPNDPTAQMKLADAEKKCKELQAKSAQDKDKDAKLASAMAKADALFKANKLSEAKSAYQQVLAINPASDVAKKQIVIIDQNLKDQAQQAEAFYKSLVDAADEAFDTKKLPLAKENYQKALALKPTDTYVQGQIKLVDSQIAEQQKKESQNKELEAKYNAAIASADALFKTNKYPEARKAYQDAQIIKPSSEYAQKQISAIDDFIKKQAKDADAAYKAIIDAADEAFDSKKLPLAKENYQKALALKPSDTYVQGQIKLVDSQIAEQQKNEAKNKELEAKYNAAIASADALFKTNKYPEARKAYQDAQIIKPSSEYAQKQISAIDDLMQKQAKDAESAYKAIIDAAEEAFDAKNLPLAKQNYQKALALRPNDLAVQNQMKLIDSQMADQQKKDAQNKATQDAYKLAIADADKAFTANDFNKARESYLKASTILANEDYPKQKIKEIDNSLKAKDKEQEQQYKASIKAGDKALDNENFALALESFKKALSTKPGDVYAADKIKTIEGLIAEQQKAEADKKAKQDQYNKAVADADLAFKKPDYKAASEGYKKALQILPSESYPKEKLSEIEIIQKDMSDKLELDYANKVRSGDRNFATKNYAQAKIDYADALKMKPSETYPTQRISDIDKLIQEQTRLAAEQKAKDDSYNASIAKADNLLKSKQYDQAILAYKEASAFKPNEKLPFTKIDEIVQIKKDIETENKYKQAIASADSYLAKKQYEQAKSFYSQALDLKANDNYATTQIAKADKEINDQLKLLSDQKAKQEAYDKAVADGDKLFAAKDFDMAKANYQRALAIFADKPIPKQKISDIDRIIKENKIADEFNAVLSEANNLFTSKNYDQAKLKYKASLLIKPAEVVPNEKIKAIDQILAQQLADKQKQEQLEKNYNETINKANDLFEKAQYDLAKKEYESALTIMPNETYPKQKLARISEIKKMLAKDAATTTVKAKPAGETKIADLKFKNDSERQQYLKELLAKYPPGITCEVYKEKARTITRYIIIRENVAYDFREVKFNWGGVDYYRNDKPITSLYFGTQVKVREGEYFNKTEM
jgi:tetratricopeptide (TPR) repeat protein